MDDLFSLKEEDKDIFYYAMNAAKKASTVVDTQDIEKAIQLGRLYKEAVVFKKTKQNYKKWLELIKKIEKMDKW